MNVGELITVLAGDPYFTAMDTVCLYGKSKILIGRGAELVAEINLETNKVFKRVGDSIDADSCTHTKEVEP